VRVFLADKVEQIPGSVRKNDAMDLGVILNGVEQVIERVARPRLGNGGEEAFGFFSVLPMDCVADRFGGCAALGK
jgi:hypothetical protein